MDYIDQKYIHLLSPRLRNFKQKGPSNYNFSCCFCNDSALDLRKARGYIYDKSGKPYFFCHNGCGGLQLSSFIKRLDSLLYSEYRFEKLNGERKPAVSKKEIDFSTSGIERLQVQSATKVFNKLERVGNLPSNHPAVQVLKNRKIPQPYWHIFRWTPGFKTFTNSLIPKKFEHPEKDEGRILIPFYNDNDILHAYQGRAVGNIDKKYRYITIVTDETTPCLWGLDSVDLTQPTYVFEGVLDAVFVSNSLAIAGGNFASLHMIKKDPKNMILCYDNEKHSKETKKKMLEAVEQGFSVVVWPSNIEEKDVNDMIVKENLTTAAISHIIEQNTFSGLKAKNAIIHWSKR